MTCRSNYIIGVDPGANGAIAVTSLRNDKMRVEQLYMFNKDALYAITGELPFGEVWIEKVHANSAFSASTAFKFGYYAGLVEGALIAYDYDIHFVPPQTWQSQLRIKTYPCPELKTSPKKAIKGNAIGYAYQNFTNFKEQVEGLSIVMISAFADACCIAAYGWMMRKEQDECEH